MDSWLILTHCCYVWLYVIYLILWVVIDMLLLFMVICVVFDYLGNSLNFDLKFWM